MVLRLAQPDAWGHTAHLDWQDLNEFGVRWGVPLQAGSRAKTMHGNPARALVMELKLIIKLMERRYPEEIGGLWEQLEKDAADPSPEMGEGYERRAPRKPAAPRAAKPKAKPKASGAAGSSGSARGAAPAPTSGG